jgi:hypothetical protein
MLGVIEQAARCAKCTLIPGLFYLADRLGRHVPERGLFYCYRLVASDPCPWLTHTLPVHRYPLRLMFCHLPRACDAAYLTQAGVYTRRNDHMYQCRLTCAAILTDSRRLDQSVAVCLAALTADQSHAAKGVDSNCPEHSSFSL